MRGTYARVTTYTRLSRGRARGPAAAIEQLLCMPKITFPVRSERCAREPTGQTKNAEPGPSGPSLVHTRVAQSRAVSDGQAPRPLLQGQNPALRLVPRHG